MNNSLWESFREELVATSMVMVVTIGGSFYLLNILVSPKVMEEKPEPTKSPAHQVVEGMVQVLGQYDQPSLKPTSMPVTIVPSPVANSPTPDPYQSEVFYGVGGLYEYDEYRMEINSPRLTFDARSSDKRKLLIDIVITNKTVTEGMNTILTASVVKDGVIIVPAAALSVSESKIIMPGQTYSFQARLSLIESTDVKEISYKPVSAPITIHTLLP